jgi:hypothetical protein
MNTSGRSFSYPERLSSTSSAWPSGLALPQSLLSCPPSCSIGFWRDQPHRPLTVQTPRWHCSQRSSHARRESAWGGSRAARMLSTWGVSMSESSRRRDHGQQQYCREIVLMMLTEARKLNSRLIEDNLLNGWGGGGVVCGGVDDGQCHARQSTRLRESNTSKLRDLKWCSRQWRKQECPGTVMGDGRLKETHSQAGTRPQKPEPSSLSPVQQNLL